MEMVYIEDMNVFYDNLKKILPTSLLDEREFVKFQKILTLECIKPFKLRTDVKDGDETSNNAKLHSHIAITLDKNGKIALANGKYNAYVISEDALNTKYYKTGEDVESFKDVDLVTDGYAKLDGIYNPTGKPQLFLHIPNELPDIFDKTDIINNDLSKEQLSELYPMIKIDGLSFKAPWGEQQRIKAGGYLNVTNPEEIYGIAEYEFEATYKPA